LFAARKRTRALGLAFLQDGEQVKDVYWQ